jgi:hypothetical protein
MERGPLGLVSTTVELLDKKVAALVNKTENTAVGVPLRWPRDTSLFAKVGTNFADWATTACQPFSPLEVKGLPPVCMLLFCSPYSWTLKMEWYVLPKRQFTSNVLQGVISHNQRPALWDPQILLNKKRLLSTCHMTDAYCVKLHDISSRVQGHTVRGAGRWQQKAAGEGTFRCLLLVRLGPPQSPDRHHCRCGHSGPVTSHTEARYGRLLLLVLKWVKQTHPLKYSDGCDTSACGGRDRIKVEIVHLLDDRCRVAPHLSIQSTNILDLMLQRWPTATLKPDMGVHYCWFSSELYRPTHLSTVTAVTRSTVGGTWPDQSRDSSFTWRQMSFGCTVFDTVHKYVGPCVTEMTYGIAVYFFGPVSPMITCNVAFFVLTARSCSKVKAEIYRMQQNSIGDRCKRRYQADKNK